MNLLHLKYAVEVAKTRSINKAAENLYMNQPNLSRAIKELEESLGVMLFKRTSRGIQITPEGETFLVYAQRILRQVDEAENIFRQSQHTVLPFSLAAHPAPYIARAFSRFSGRLDSTKPIELFYKEASNRETLQLLLQSEYKLGILRYPQYAEEEYRKKLTEKGLSYELIYEFTPVVVLSCRHPLAEKDTVTQEDLRRGIRLVTGEDCAPAPLSADSANKTEEKRVFVFDSGSLLSLLQTLPNAFACTSPLSRELLEQYHLVQKPCQPALPLCRDILVCPNDYHFSETDHSFITELCRTKRECSVQ